MGGGISLIAQYAGRLGILGDLDYISNWFQVHTRFGHLLPTFGTIAAVLSCNLGRNSRALRKAPDRKLKINALIGRFMITSLMLIPVFILNLTYERLQRVYFLAALSYYANERLARRMPLVKFIALIFTCITIGYSFYIGIGAFKLFDTTLGAVLKYNRLM